MRLVEGSAVTKTIIFCNKVILHKVHRECILVFLFLSFQITVLIYIGICFMQIETCRKVENVLNRLDRKGTRTRVFPFHAALAQESRLANMEEFCSSQLEDQSLFLVCTDRYMFLLFMVSFLRFRMLLRIIVELY